MSDEIQTFVDAIDIQPRLVFRANMSADNKLGVNATMFHNGTVVVKPMIGLNNPNIKNVLFNAT